jgi:hypothetical protein
LFEQMSRLKINLLKGEVYCLGKCVECCNIWGNTNLQVRYFSS